MDMHNEVSDKFDDAARNYDRQRRQLIPCFDDYYQAAVSLAEANAASPAILDLGAGTGLLASLLLRKYPKAKVTLIDLSEKMLDAAKTRLGEYADIEYLLGDYTNYVSDRKFDLIVSALSIHHLTDSDKRTLYENAYANLKPNGMFVNADQVLGPTTLLDSMYKNDWKNKVEASGLARAEIDSAYERTKLDRMASLKIQLDWLQEIGFSDVDCVYKSYSFAVLYGRKPA